MVKRGGGLIYFCIQMRGGGVIGEGLEEKGAKYRNYSTSIPSYPFPNMLQERGQLQGLKPGLHVMYLVIWSNELVNISLPIISC
jgi:hypothetical protein